MNIQFAKRIQNIKPSPTLAITARTAEMLAQGHDIISLGAGEPDFDTPFHIREAAIDAIKNGFTRYTAVSGTNSLKEAICQKFLKDNQLQYSPDNILVSCGAKQAIYNAALALLNPGDEVIIPAPYWVSYPDIAILAEARPIFINTNIEQRFKITPDQLHQAITARTKLIILNSPSNPAGTAYSLKELQDIGEVLRQHPDIMILSDDIYEHILWTSEPFSNIVMACPDLYDRAIIINGVSKTYAMTGWRIGYAAAPINIIKAMSKIQSQSTSNPCSISQKAAEAALNGDQSFLKQMLQAFKERHDWLVKNLNDIPGIKCIAGDGTFYILFKATELITHIPVIKNDIELSEYLINEIKVAMIPGTAFGTPGYLRISFATNLDNLKQAMSRLKSIL